MQTNNLTAESVRIRGVLEQFGKLPIPVSEIDELADLYDNGLTSHASVNVMIALEDEFDIEFPDSMLQKSTFGSISAISDALARLSA
ncbi:acyl carrier protein [Rhodococcus sp. P1Y]|uniref:acyl carrier protein n=1 Tax=Rhodococcus sp. P1Y TaxID=1302308 RepID=UPI000EB4478F|nr:acyl carrier protein [Rhodococcus sp. P1Y]AYJ48182.1 acyl carrier protein [Rhodococcus sp. P1Y]